MRVLPCAPRKLSIVTGAGLGPNQEVQLLHRGPLTGNVRLLTMAGSGDCSRFGDGGLAGTTGAACGAHHGDDSREQASGGRPSLLRHGRGIRAQP
jgi:hypothetical protein